MFKIKHINFIPERIAMPNKADLSEVNEQDNLIHSESKNLKDKNAISGNILIFYAYDIGDSIELNKLKSRKILQVHDMEPFPHFKNYHVPLAVDITDFCDRGPGVKVYAKIHSFGVISLNYIIPFSETFNTLKFKLIQQVEDHNLISKRDARDLFSKIKFVVQEPVFFNLKSTYYAVQADNKALSINNKVLVKNYGHIITSLLRLETKTMSDYQVEEILEASTAYYGSDLLVISAEGAFIYDNEYHEPLEFFELASIQKLELQFFDRHLDKKLNYFYNIDTYKVPLKSYIPLLGSRIDTMLMDLAKLRVDISVITERLNNNVNMTGDSYFQKLYTMLVKAFKLQDWKSSIDEKLSIISEMYTVRKNRLDTVREEMLTLFVLFFIVLEVTIAWLK